MKTTLRYQMLSSLAVLAVLGCANTLEPNEPGDNTNGPIFTHVMNDDGSITTTVDATSSEEWRYLDLDTQTAVDSPDSLDWDLSFRRFRIRTNGGVTGEGGVQIAVLDGAVFDEVERAPEDGWTVDEVDANEFTGRDDDWYNYDATNHTLSPKQRVFIVATTAGQFFKIQITDYYSDAGTSGFLQFRWDTVEPPMSPLPDTQPMTDPGDEMMMEMGMDTVELPDSAFLVEATGSDWVYVSLDAGVIEVSDPMMSDAWDLAFQRSDIRTNSGSSGGGFGGAMRDASGFEYDAITDAPTIGYGVDTERMGMMPGRSETSVNPVLDDTENPWFNYDIRTHTLTAGENNYLIRTANGDYAKLHIWRWVNGQFAISFEPVTRRVETVTTTVDAASSDAWVYLSLSNGAVVTVDDPMTDLSWDVGISRTRMRTNSGTSGAGDSGVVETTAGTWDALDMAPLSGYEADVDTLRVGPPSAPTFSGNPVLNTWYDYNPMTHAVTPRDAIFALRTVDGAYAKLRVVSYADGVYEVEYAYTGPNMTEF